jgi:hypothetical protein
VYNDDREWLPGINRWLYGGWTEVDIADRAVKSDDAQVDFRPWHLRISLVFPCSPRSLDVLSRFAMRRWRFNIVTSFVEYLTIHYGPDWKNVLFNTPAFLPSGSHGLCSPRRGIKRPCDEVRPGHMVPPNKKGGMLL